MTAVNSKAHNTDTALKMVPKYHSCSRRASRGVVTGEPAEESGRDHKDLHSTSEVEKLAGVCLSNRPPNRCCAFQAVRDGHLLQEEQDGGGLGVRRGGEFGADLPYHGFGWCAKDCSADPKCWHWI